MRLHPRTYLPFTGSSGAVAIIILVAAFTASPAAAQQWDDIRWDLGPTHVKLGKVAEIEIPAGYWFSGAEGTRTFLELFENPTSGSELGVIIPEITQNGVIDWFVIFEFDDIGYVTDDEQDMDDDAILESIRGGTEAANKVRRERGWGTIEVVGWERMPFYDPNTNNLTWAITGRSDEGTTVNYSTRLLGRRGVINADLIIDPDQIWSAVPEFQRILNGTAFQRGQRYQEFVKGDKVAAIGLTALVAGGVGALALKSGLLAKFWKVLVGLAIAAAAGVRKLFGGRSAADGTPAA